MKGSIFTCQMMRNLTKLGQSFVKHWYATHAKLFFKMGRLKRDTK